MKNVCCKCFEIKSETCCDKMIDRMFAQMEEAIRIDEQKGEDNEKAA